MAFATGKLVLVVEDDDSMRMAIERLLNAAGVSTAAFASAEALLTAGATSGIGCILTDFKLPAMSGLELLTELRARGGWPPVILMTAHDAPEVRDEAQRCGAAGYLAKPFEGSVLLAAIERVVGQA